MEPLGLDDVDELQTTELFRDSSVDLPAVADGTLYVDNGKTYAIDVETGETEWSRYTQAVETPLVTQDTVYIAAGGAQVHSIDRNQGEFRWSTTLDQDPPTDEDNQTIRTVPVVVEGNVIVGVWSYGDDERGWFTALDARCGSKRWSIGVSQESPRGLATDGQTVYAATDHHLYALDAEDGTQHWRVKVTDEDLDSDAPPALEGETVILKGSDLTALATADGSVRWTRDLGVPYPPTVTADSIYVVEDDTATVHALDIETGETRWTVTDLPEELETSLTYVSDKLYSRDRSGALIVLDATTGEVHSEGELEIKSSGNVHRLAITPDGIFTRGSPTEGQKSDVVTRFTPN